MFLASSCVVVSAVPPNDRCVDSITLTMGEKVAGDNSDANYDYNNQGVCGSRSDRRAVWYEINGVGKEVTVNVCTNNEQITDFGVFRTCNTQNCLGAPPQQRVIADCEAEESNEYKFIGNEGESYYIHVRSDVFFEGVGSNFTIWYTEPTDAPTTVPMIEESEPTASGSDSSKAEGESASFRLRGESIVFCSIVISMCISHLTSLI